MSQLTCFFKQYASRGSSTPFLTRKAVYLSRTLIQCPVPSPHEFPLPCTCQCSGSTPASTQSCLTRVKSDYQPSGPIQSNVTNYNFDGGPVLSSSRLDQAICSCCPGIGKGNCSVSVGIGVNLQLATYGQGSIFLYMLEVPLVPFILVFNSVLSFSRV